MSLLLVTQASFAFIVLLYSVETYADIYQKPVALPLPGRNYTSRPDPELGLGRQNRGRNESCQNDGDCKWYLCCLRRNGRKSCQRKNVRGERCSDGQIKGGYHVGNCPCLWEIDQCRNKVCKASHQRHEIPTWYPGHRWGNEVIW
uniref:Dickkopf N-terminal cysteine-rich domain-containing protein n=1 Tax=Amblyomma maculatum TaxID=34609 RepID=G3MTM5_AMBMU